MDKYLQDLQLLSDKVGGVCDESWDEIAAQLGYNYSTDTLRKSLNGEYGGAAVYQYMLDKESSYASDAQIEEFEKLKDDLYKERVKLQDANREHRNDLREEARYENLCELLEEKLDLLEPLNVKKVPLHVDNPCVAFALLSDVHYGMTIDNVFEYYDMQVAQERLYLWRDKVIAYCKRNNVNSLNIGFLGDLTSGLIHLQQRVAQEEDVIDQIVKISEILSEIIVNIESEINEVKLYGVVGNHCRVVANKNDSLPSENFERLIFEYIKLRTGCQVIQNGKEDFVECYFGSKKCVLAHGDNDTISNAKQHFSDILGYVPDYIFLGHLHHLMEEDISGCTIIVNGSVMATDDFATKIRKNTAAYQMLIIQNQSDNDEFVYKLNLSN